MKLRNQLDVTVLSCHTVKCFLGMLLLVIAGCSSQGDGNNADEKNASRVAIPSSIQTLALPGDTSSFTANLFLDDGTTPIASSDIATDGSQSTVSFNDIAVAVGTHQFTIQFKIETPSYATVLATALSDTITVTVGSSNTLNFDINNYNFDYDDDNDLVSNFDEINAGTPPNDDVCVVGVSLVGYCRLGA